MKQTGVKSGIVGLTLQLLLAAVLHQSFATDAPPTVAPTSPAPHKVPSNPDKGHYVVNGTNGTACLLASIGIQLNITFMSLSKNKTVQEIVNLQSNTTKSAGSCDTDSASLQLTSETQKIDLNFTFTLNTTSSKYHLSEVSLTAAWTDMKIGSVSFRNNTLDYLRGTLGFSYMCREKQTLSVAQNLSINIFQVQVQPFGVVGTQFGAAEECQLDEDDMLIPIIVGAALAGLVLIVLLAYLIGRKRSHAGYQSI
ncbi:hypothetical protein JOB18_023099 [Solea senegalensis]|uniref:Lysosome-associated membrane glycoprotein 1 n=1 Tax=Solea senegalensis TaxID=28829 RepID=A0AAV6RB90_SOLSE|nr:lysosome-associated membrane glycoprotein 1-like [Solea senegalensis]KAG7502598.1 lysosome-associated membrane glycoprotein 1-like [Solea senegalensis]KAG7502599.1 hypothetical protein JOB18_023099 [Solea senegalensis]